MRSDRFVALYALRLGNGKFFLFIGDTETSRLPLRPSWLPCLTFEDWQGKTKPETDALCRKHGADVLFVLHIQQNAHGSLLRSKLQPGKEKQNGLDHVPTD